MVWNPKNLPDRGGWTDGVVAEPWEGFEICYECHGDQLCPCCGGRKSHPSSDVCVGPVSWRPNPRGDGSHLCVQCKGTGWCYLCGGAGQWPVDPKAPWFAPSLPMINLAHRARIRAREGSAGDSDA